MAIKDPRSAPGWDLVVRVGESPLFQKSPRLRNLLFYICENTLLNRPEELREQRIGEVLFDRGADFRPNEDNIVRVEAARLRKRLAEHFAGAGAEEPVVITIPKGAYLAQFERREAAPEELAPDTEIAPPAPAAVWRRALPWALVSLTLIALAVWLGMLGKHPQPLSAGGDLLWPELFDREHPTYIVCADTSLLVLQEFVKKPISLNEYLDRSYGSPSGLSPELTGSLRLLMTRHFTGIYDLRVAQAILHRNRDHYDPSCVKSARDVQAGDFKNANFVLLGAKRANPWVELFEPALNFQFVYDFATRRSGYRNLAPKPGEEGLYSVGADVLPPSTAYSLIAFLPNLRHDGNVLLIGSTSGEGTEAAAMLLVRAALLTHMLKTIHAQEGQSLRHFEVLLKSRLSNGISSNPEVVAYRLLRSEQ